MTVALVALLIIGVQIANWLGFRQTSPSEATRQVAQEVADLTRQFRLRDSLQGLRDSAEGERERKRDEQDRRNSYQFCVLFRRPQQACDDIMGIQR